jgi:hypothetical protein
LLVAYTILSEERRERRGKRGEEREFIGVKIRHRFFTPCTP